MSIPPADVPRARPSRLATGLKTAVSIALIAWLASMLDFERIARLSGAAWLTVPAGAAVTLSMLAIMTLRWRRLIAPQQGNPLSFPTAYRGYRMGGFFSLFLPGAIGGDLFRIKYAADEAGLSLTESTLVVATERLFGLTSLTLMFLVALPLDDRVLKALELDAGLVILAAGLGLATLAAVKMMIARHIELPFAEYPLLVGLSGIAQFGDVVIMYGVTQALGHTAPIASLMLIMPLVFVATVLPISLGGLGVREGVLGGLLMLLGLPRGDAILAAFLLYLAKVTAGLAGAPPLLRMRASERE